MSQNSSFSVGVGTAFRYENNAYSACDTMLSRKHGINLDVWNLEDSSAKPKGRPDEHKALSIQKTLALLSDIID